MPGKLTCILAAILISMTCSKQNSKSTSADILRIVECGTDSLQSRDYFPGTENKLYSTTTQYFNSKIQTFVYYYDVDKRKVNEIKSYVAQRIYGNYFEFYKSGMLKTFCFYVGGSGNCSRLMRFNPDGDLISEDGTPFVDYITTGTNFQLLLSQLFFDTLAVEIATKNSAYQPISLKRSALQPPVLEASVPKTIDPIFMRIKAVSKYTKQETIYNDTLIFR